MKKFFVLCVVFSILFTFAACNNSTTGQNESSNIEILEGKNVALNKQVFVSSYNSALGMLPENVVDGDDGTSWSSDTAKKNIDEWVVVDLGENYNIDAVNVKWGRSFSPKFSIEISRGGAEFTEIYSAKNSEGGSTSVPAKKAIGRYVRISCKNVVSLMDTYMGAAIQEIEISGTLANDQTLGKETETMVTTKIVSIEKDDVLRGGRSYKFNTLAAAGSTYEYQCTGRAAGAVITGESGQFEVSIDGGDYMVFQIKKGTHEYLFTDKLEDGVHTVRITRQSECYYPLFSVEQIIVEDSADIVKGYKGNYDLKIEFVGDSLTTAQGVDYSQSYVVEACKLLNAHFQVVARGGMGIYRNYDNGSQDTLPYYYQWTEYQNRRNDKPYTYDADVVVFNIGGNDAVCQLRFFKEPEECEKYVVEYEKLYYRMLDEVFVANPNATVICCYGQLGYSTKVLQSIDGIVEKYKADHPERRVEILRFDFAIDFTVTNDGHPGPKSHKRDGKVLAEKIQEVLK